MSIPRDYRGYEIFHDRTLRPDFQWKATKQTDYGAITFVTGSCGKLFARIDEREGPIE